MILEIAMGRRFRGTVVSSFGAVPPEFRIVGWFLCAIVFLILSYYLVITGWTIAYTVFSVTGDAVSFSGFTGYPAVPLCRHSRPPDGNRRVGRCPEGY